MGQLVLIRHGETAWSRTGQHAGRTDLPLTEAGEESARALAPRLADREFAAVHTSPLTRAVRTAELAGLSSAKPDTDLIEWDYGRYEGLTAEQIQEFRPGWELWRDGVDDGEDLGQVTVRVDAFLGRVRPLLDQGDVAVVAHGHLSRILTARWLRLDASAGRQFGHPHPGTINTLGHEHGLPVVLGWNVP
ncbi:histidine phosphatase family protein [Streptomyces sp. NPDC087270]|uniref:histidine phosphatase family protein n=1 Tax=Streptomyces sp. NPDC087270 TaxID=3365774 RepID=UPI0037F78D1F